MFVHKTAGLVTAIATDAALSQEEAQIFQQIGDITDDHPDAHACRLRVSLAVADRSTIQIFLRTLFIIIIIFVCFVCIKLLYKKIFNNSPIECDWDDRIEYGMYCSKVTHVAARCRIDADDEFQVFKML